MSLLIIQSRSLHYVKNKQTNKNNNKKNHKNLLTIVRYVNIATKEFLGVTGHLFISKDMTGIKYLSHEMFMGVI